MLMFLSAAINFGNDWLPARKLTRLPNDFTMCDAMPPQPPNGPKPHQVSTGGADIGSAILNTVGGLAHFLEWRDIKK
jgi:hypothetical protein